MYNEMKINIKIFYYTIKKIEPQTLARKGFFCNYTHRLNKLTAREVFKENKEDLGRGAHC